MSRFREEIAEGYPTGVAVRRTVMTAGRTVVFSATMIVACLGGLLLFPQGFLKSVAYGAIATVSLAALTAVTILPAILGILGKRIDAFGLKRFRKTKTADEIDASIWGRLTRWVMQNPLKVAIPIVVGLLLLVIPVKNIEFGGINEKYLPPNNPTRLAQEEFDRIFPLRGTEPIKLVITSSDTRAVGQIRQEASNAPGLTGPFALPSTQSKDDVWILTATLTDRNVAQPTIDYLRAINVPDGTQMLVGGTPAIERDSIHALLDRMPLMIVLVLLVTTLLMFLTFGSLVLPIKAALMSALGLGATLGILTWIFVDGHGAELLNFTPGPIMSPVLVLIIAIIYGLSTDYEVFLLSRMVEARARGASTTEAIRVGIGTDEPHHHRGRADPDRRDRRLRVLRTGDDEVHRLRHDRGADHRRHPDPDVPGARDDEAARRRLLVGAAVDAADPAQDRHGRTHPRRRPDADRDAGSHGTGRDRDAGFRRARSTRRCAARRHHAAPRNRATADGPGTRRSRPR